MKHNTERQNHIERKELLELFTTHPSIIATYLFGSQVKGTAKPESDIDVTILRSAQPDSSFDLLSLIVKAEEITDKNVDIVRSIRHQKF